MVGCDCAGFQGDPGWVICVPACCCFFPEAWSLQYERVWGTETGDKRWWTSWRWVKGLISCYHFKETDKTERKTLPAPPDPRAFPLKATCDLTEQALCLALFLPSSPPQVTPLWLGGCCQAFCQWHDSAHPLKHSHDKSVCQCREENTELERGGGGDMIKDKQEAHKQGNTGGVRRLWTANQRKLSSCSYFYLIINNFFGHCL